jgi:hypothetical protein
MTRTWLLSGERRIRGYLLQRGIETTPTVLLYAAQLDAGAPNPALQGHGLTPRQHRRLRHKAARSAAQHRAWLKAQAS